MQIRYEVVPAGGQRDTGNAHMIGTAIVEGGKKGWKFVTVISDFEQNYVVFEVPGKPQTEKRG